MMNASNPLTPLTTQAVTVVWLRQCFRLNENPLYHHAHQLGLPVVIITIHAPHDSHAPDWQLGEAAQGWLHATLHAHAQQLEATYQQPLFTLKASTALEALTQLKQTLPNLTNLITDERWEPHAKQQQTHVAQWASDAGINFHVHNTSVLQHPTQRKNKQGNPFQVFTPFWKHSLPLLHEEATAPISPPASLPRLNELTTLAEGLQALQALPCAVPLEALGLRPRLPWYPALMSHWQAGEAGAEALLQQFLAHAVHGYKEDRNVPSVAGTSKLSPYLQVGAISPWRVFHAVHNAFAERGLHDSATHYISELGWREFSHHLLEHFPHTPTHPLRPEFSQFPWEENPEVLERWQAGQTGVPIVDAGMRELYATGWMHNRTRMIVASYLVKNLQQHWLAGARWFWDTLIDADLAQNTQGWQWTAGCGADAAPYFRIFNPVLQGQKFDSAGHYVKHWVPELANLNAKDVHTPWEVKPALLRMDGITLGDTYPSPLVDLNESRQRALQAYETVKKKD